MNWSQQQPVTVYATVQRIGCFKTFLSSSFFLFSELQRCFLAGLWSIVPQLQVQSVGYTVTTTWLTQKKPLPLHQTMYNNLHHFHHGCTFNFFHFEMISTKSSVTFLFPPCFKCLLCSGFYTLNLHDSWSLRPCMVTCITILTVGHKCSEDFLLADVRLIFGSFW